MSILELKDITYFYESAGRQNVILEDANCEFEKGKLYTIVEPSGSGKTTTLTLAGALESPKEGEVDFDGEDIQRVFRCSVILQKPHRTPVFAEHKPLWPLRSFHQCIRINADNWVIEHGKAIRQS